MDPVMVLDRVMVRVLARAMAPLRVMAQARVMEPVRAQALDSATGLVKVLAWVLAWARG